MDNLKLSSHEMLLQKERELLTDLRNIADQMTKTLISLDETRKALKDTCYLRIVRDNE